MAVALFKEFFPVVWREMPDARETRARAARREGIATGLSRCSVVTTNLSVGKCRPNRERTKLLVA